MIYIRERFYQDELLHILLNLAAQKSKHYQHQGSYNQDILLIFQLLSPSLSHFNYHPVARAILHNHYTNAMVMIRLGKILSKSEMRGIAGLGTYGFSNLEPALKEMQLITEIQATKSEMEKAKKCLTLRPVFWDALSAIPANIRDSYQPKDGLGLS